MKIVYVTNTDLKESSGGGSGVNQATFIRLKAAFDIVEPITLKPKPDPLSKLKSKLLKALGIKRNYHFFSKKRLDDIAKKFKASTKNKETDIYFFHAFTPWISTKPNRPYFCFNDACFATYVEIYNNINEFSRKDLQRIYDMEAKWLQGAERVFFRSKWALNETKNAYGLSGTNFVNVGVGGFIDIPYHDSFMDFDCDSYNFLFISREFVPKGGITVVKAIQNLRNKGIDARLWVVGEDPGKPVSILDGIEYLGFFRKSDDIEKEKLREIFSNAFALIHPTLKDINPLVILELAYYGCPTIASNRFAISEYLKDGKSGYLVSNPKDANELCEKMQLMINDKYKYIKMRKFARENSLKNNTWNNVGERIVKEILN